MICLRSEDQFICHSKAAVNKRNRKDNNYHHGMQYLYIKVSININLFRRAVLISSIRGWVWVARLNYWASTCSSWLRPAPPPPLRGPHQPVARSYCLCLGARSCCRRDTDSTRAAVVMPESLLLSTIVLLYFLFSFPCIVCPFVFGIVFNKIRFFSFLR